MKRTKGAQAPLNATEARGAWPRRRLLAWLAAAGVGSVFSRGLVTLAEGQTVVTADQIRQAEWISGVAFTEVLETVRVIEAANRSRESGERTRLR